MKLRLATGKVLITIIALLLLSALTLFAVIIAVSKQVNNIDKLTIRKQEVLYHSEKMLAGVSAAETASSAYLLTGQPFFLETFEHSKKEFPFAISRLGQLTADNPAEQLRIVSTLGLINQRIAFIDSILNYKKNGISQEAAQKLVVAIKSTSTLNNIKQLTGQLQAEESILSQVRLEANRQIAIVSYYIFPAVVFLLLFFMLVFIWIARQKVQDEEQKKSYAMFCGMLESAPGAMVIFDEKDEMVLINQHAEKLFGYDKNELIGKPFEVLVPENMPPGYIHHQNGFKKEPLKWVTEPGMESVALKKGGEKFPAEIMVSYFQTGKRHLISVSFRDITERRKTEESQRKTQKEFQLLLASMKDYAIFLVDKKGLVTSWNSGAEKIKGYATHEIIGRSMDVFYTTEDIQKGEPKNNLQMALQHGYFESEGWRLRKNGFAFWARVVYTALIDDTGSLYGFANITRDITKRKKARELLESLSPQINQSKDAIYTSDANRKIKSWNKGAELLYGLTKEEVIGKDSNEILNTAITGVEIITSRKEIARQDYWTSEFKRKTKNGQDIYVRSSTTIIKNITGLVTGYVTLSFDITAQKGPSEDVNHLASIVDQSTEAIISIGLDQRIISWNNGAEKMHGYTKEEAIGKISSAPGFIVFTENKISSVFKEVLEWGYSKAEINFLRKNGSTFFGAVAANLVKNEQGEITSTVFMIKDISTRKQLEEQLKRSNEELEQKVKARTEEIYRNEKRFRALIENNNDIISLLDESFQIFYRSPSAFRITGWSDEEMIHLDSHKNAHPEDIEKTNNVKTELMAYPGKPVNTLFRSQHKNGHFIWLEGIAINLLNDEDIRAVVFNFRDVTQRIESEEKLVSSEILYRSLIENSAEGIALTDEFSNVIYRSPATQKISGNLPMENTVSRSHPDDLETIKNTIAKALRKPGVPIAFQGRFLHASDRYFWMEGTLTNMLHLKGVNAIVANYRDITQRKEAEEKLIKSEKIYKTIASSIPGSAICLLDADYRYLLTEGDMLGKLGYSKEKLLGKKAEDILAPEIFAGVQLQFKKVLGGQTVTSESSSRGYDIISKFIPLKDENNVVYAIMTVAIDVTKLKNAQRDIIGLNHDLEEKIIKRTGELEKSNEDLQAFSYSISHDLRGPLRAIIGYTTILEEDYSNSLDDEAKRITSVIKQNTLKMNSLIDDLLSFSQSSRQEIVKALMNSNKMVKEAIAELENKVGNGQIEWAIASLPIVNAHTKTIKQVWINLISNAIKYSGKNEHPKIEIGSMKAENETVFFVRDNGAGFDEKYKEKLFKVFQRLHTDEDFEGTGAGLAIVEKIIEKHGGKVWAEGELGKGACFYFSIPDE